MTKTTPPNLLMFGDPTALLEGNDKDLEEQFYNFLKRAEERKQMFLPVSVPMTTGIAELIHGLNHTEDGTCSVQCSNCDGRVWFTGNMGDQKQEYTCPYCNSIEWNKNLGDQ